MRGIVDGNAAADGRTRTVAAGFAAARGVFGIAYLLAPAPISERWIGPVGAGRPAGVLSRSVGVRDLALGAGAAAAALRGEPEADRWFWAHALCDALDVAGTLAAGDAIPSREARNAAVVAGASCVGAVACAVALRGAADTRGQLS